MNNIPLLPATSARYFLIVIDYYRPEYVRKNLGLVAEWIARRGVPVAFVTNATEANEGIAEVHPGVPLVRLPIPPRGGAPLHHPAYYRFLWRNRRAIRWVWLYRARRYVPLTAMLVKLRRGKVLIKLDGEGGAYPLSRLMGAMLPSRWLTRSRRVTPQGPAVSGEHSHTADHRRPLSLAHRLSRLFRWPFHWAVADLPLFLADAILCEEPALVQGLARCGLGARCFLFPNPVPVEEMAEVEARLRATGVVRQKVVLSVGRVIPEKGFDDLVRAFALVPAERRAGWRLRIVGPVQDAAYYASLRRLTGELLPDGSVEFVTGLYGDDLYRAYMEAGIFVMAYTSGGGGQPNVVTEAMALGCTIVGTTVGGIPFELDHGRCGRLVPPEAPAELAMALSELMVDARMRKAVGTAARQRALREFSLEHTMAPVATRLGLPTETPR
ncbi:MAG: glycosyltransferase [Chloroflexi bacterium]|nr:glycosyltransferase [Chloroflexota bacterium]